MSGDNGSKFEVAQSTDEMIAEVDESTGVVIGEVGRNVAHKNGIWHASVHVWILDGAGRLLWQRRNPASRVFPGLWDISAAGHIRGDEDGLREVAEELGVTPEADELSYLGEVLVMHDEPGFINREWARVWIWRSELELSDFSFPDGEVMALAAVDLRDLPDFLAGGSVEAEVLANGEISFELISGKQCVGQIPSYWEAVRGGVGC